MMRRIALCLCALAIAGAAGVGGLAWHAGYRIYVVHTGSMTPTLNPGDAVLDRPAPDSVHSGEVITFAVHSGPDSVVTHRVASVDGTTVKTKGDANRTVDPWTLHISQVVGSQLLALPHMGYLLVYLQHPQGISSVLTSLVALILLWQIFFPVTAPSGGRSARHKGEPLRKHDDEPSPVTPLPSLRLLESYHVAATAAPRQR